MEQVGEGRGDENKQHHPRPPPQQQCPRCGSLDTKFSYYNNYSLLQPRYLCKACKRCWTQGGTLRNIPIGGGRSRRGKRSKSSSSSTINSSQPQMQLRPQPQPDQLQVQLQSQPAIQELVQNQTNLTTLMRNTPHTMVQSTSPYYYQGSGVGGGGGYLSSLVAVHSLNPSPQSFNQSLNILPFNQQHNHRSQIYPPQFNQIGRTDREVESMLRAEQGYHITPNMANSNVEYHSDHWPQSFVSDATHRASDASLCSTIRTTSSGANIQNDAGFGSSSSLMQNHWPNLPGYGSHQ